MQEAPPQRKCHTERCHRLGGALTHCISCARWTGVQYMRVLALLSSLLHVRGERVRKRDGSGGGDARAAPPGGAL